MPIRSASSTSPSVSLSTPKRPTIPAWSRRLCSSVSPPKARPLRNGRRAQRRRDGSFTMTHPGEQFYPKGVRWDETIDRGTLPDLLSEAAQKFGDRPAIEFRDRAISFNELEALAETAAAAFLRAGCGKGATVALFLGNSPDHPVSFFGALKAGSRIAHLSPLDGERALSHKLSDSGARILVTSNLATLLPAAVKFLEQGLIDRLIVCEDDHWGAVGNPHTPIPDDPAITTFAKFAEGATKPAQWPDVTPDDVALLQYTGGTTGLPKGAMLSHGNLTSAVSIYEVWTRPTRLERNTIDRVICVLPLFHIYALTVVMLSALRVGNLISLHQRFDVEAVMRDIEVKRATAFPGVPTMWIAIASLPDLDRRDFSSLAVAGSGGAPLPVEVAKVFERRTNLKLKSGWGMTETCSPGTGHPQEGLEKPGSIGLMLPGIEMDVVALDDPKKMLAAGEVGEIRIKGPNVTKGYWNNPAGSAEAFVGDRFLTGDIGYMDADGYFFLVDRKKDMIISGGFNVYPQMIEQAIYEHPAVQEVIVIGIADEYRGEAAKAFIKLRAGSAAFSLDDLKAFLSGKLGRHEIPAALAFVDELPRTPVGKLSRHELRSQQAKSQPAQEHKQLATGGRS